MKIGAYALHNAVFVAPMAGITDRPFRRLARRYGAALAFSEMVSARPELRESRKTQLRLDHRGEREPISVQIAGSDPAMLAAAARYNVERGAQIIDINMGCPAKKVCNVAAGSALLENEALVAHLDGLYDLYGDEQGTRVARKHIGWTVRELPGGEGLRERVNGMTVAQAQRAAVNDYFERLAA